MSVLMIEGWDKYGGVNSNTTTVAAMLLAGEWTTLTGGSQAAIVAGLSATGQALSLVLNAVGMSKTLAANYSRLVGGVRFSSNLGGSGQCGMTFYDSGTSQCSIVFNQTGTFSVRNGSIGGTVLGTSSGAPISANTTHYLEWDITFGNSAASYQLWLDGVSILTGTGDTTGTVNNYANSFAISSAANASVIIFDDLYLFDTTGSTNNAVLLTSPRIETTFPVADSAVQFAPGAGILGSSVYRGSGANSPVASSLILRRFTPSVNCTINSISILPNAATSVNYRGTIYTDSGGAAGTLMSSGPTVSGTAVNVVSTFPLTTPQSLTAGTQYWVGFMTDTTTAQLFLSDVNNGAYRAAATFASGAPGTAPAMTAGQPTYMIWGNLTGMAVNYDEVNNQPPDGPYSYVYDSTVGHEDLYTFTSFSQPPVTIHTVAVKALAQKSDSGTRTVSMRTKSGATDSGGSLTGQALGTSFQWYGSYFPTDPNTGSAWGAAALNAATSGFRIDS